jgi:RND family efflux transporter MFP subunit
MQRLIILCCLAALAGPGMFMQTGCKKAEKKAGPTIVKVRKGNLKVAVSATGIVEPEYIVVIKSQASGEVEEVFVQEGDQVVKGTPLVKINPIVETRRVNQAQSDVRMAKARSSSAWLKYKYLKNQINVQKDLLKKGLVPGSTMADMEKDLGMQSAEGILADAQIAKAEEALKEAKDRLAETNIVSPTAGTVIDREVQPGQVVTSGTSSVSGGNTLLQIANLTKLFVTIKVDEADVTKLHREQDAIITADGLPGQRFKGKVLRIAPKGTIESNVTVFEVVVAADERGSKALRPQMSANVEVVVTERKGALIVPQRALERVGRGAKGAAPEYVVRMTDGKKRQVKVGLMEAGQAEILSGLSEGEEVQVPTVAAKKPAGQRRGTGVPGAPGGGRGGGH